MAGETGPSSHKDQEPRYSPRKSNVQNQSSFNILSSWQVRPQSKENEMGAENCNPKIQGVFL